MTDSTASDHELVVIAPLTTIAAGDQFGLGTVPLHLTSLPKVRVPHGELPAVLAAIDEVAAAATPLRVITAGFDLLGEASTVRVTTVEPSASLRQLHLDLLEATRAAGAVTLHPSYHGDGYRPHITHTHDGRFLASGEQAELTALAVLDCSRPTRRILSVRSLGR